MALPIMGGPFFCYGRSQIMFPEQERVAKQISHIMNVVLRSNCEIRPHFFLTGPTGSGKSYLVNKIAKDNDIAFFEINAAQLTSEGMSGNSLSKALRPLRQHWHQPNVIFVDEFDKLFQRNGEEAEHFRMNVQDEFLQILESTHASIFTDYGKYESIKISNTLFIFAGSFSGQKIYTLEDLRNTGIRNEFVGRVPLVFYTKEIKLTSMIEALPNLKLFNDYLEAFPNISKGNAMHDIIIMLKKEERNNQIGIRLINSIVHQYFMYKLGVKNG